MKLSGMLSKVMDNYLCLRGVASIKSLDEISEVNPDIQRDLLEEHKDEMKAFLERGEYAFFPEVVLSMDLGLDEGNEVFDTLVAKVDSESGGFNGKAGNVKIRFKADRNILIDYSKQSNSLKQLKVAHFEFVEENVKLSRIDGNHRLSAAKYLTNDILIPFCLIVLPNKGEAGNNSRAIFHNINSKQIPLKMEQNIKIIIESNSVFPDEVLEKDQPFGKHYKFTRELLCGTGKLDFSFFPIINKLVFETKYSFFVNLFKYLLKKKQISEGDATDAVKNQLVEVENALREARIKVTSPNSAIVGALAYYKLSNSDKCSRFIKWVANNHIADAKDVGVEDLISIFDKVYDNIPKKVFLARWYPPETDKEYKDAKLRFDALSIAIATLKPSPELIDMGKRQKGTFSIRAAINSELPTSDIFIADLTGARPNVMIEVGMALKNIPAGRVLFYFKPTTDVPKVPFDLSGYQYHEIKDSRDIDSKVVPALQNIIDELVRGG